TIWAGSSSAPATGPRSDLVRTPGSRGDVPGQPQTGELPPVMGVEEVAIAGPRMPRRRDRRAAAQHDLIGHELAVVLAGRPGRRTEARIGRERAGRPLPDLAEHLAQAGPRRRARDQPVVV